MFGLGTIINTACVLVGGFLGLLWGKFLTERFQKTLKDACGISVICLSIAGVMQYMLEIGESGLSSRYSMLVVLCIVLGGFIGELINIDHLFEKLAEWLKQKTGSQEDNNFITGFITTTFTICIGGMAIVGAIQDGLVGDYSILTAKGILDLIMVMVMTCTYGKSAIFSAIPLFVIQGLFTVLAKLIQPVMTELALAYISLVGSVLILCIGINILFGPKVKVANFLPSLLFAVIAAFLPISF